MSVFGIEKGPLKSIMKKRSGAVDKLSGAAVSSATKRSGGSHFKLDLHSSSSAARSPSHSQSMSAALSAEAASGVAPLDPSSIQLNMLGGSGGGSSRAGRQSVDGDAFRCGGGAVRPGAGTTGSDDDGSVFGRGGDRQQGDDIGDDDDRREDDDRVLNNDDDDDAAERETDVNDVDSSQQDRNNQNADCFVRVNGTKL